MASNYKDDASAEADKTFISISKHALRNWSAAMNQFSIIFEGRMPMNGINSFTHSQ